MKNARAAKADTAGLPRFFATTNPSKAEEVARILKNGIKHIKIDFVEPQSLDIDEVARFKAEYAYKAVGEPVLIEDTSLEISALNGLPGTLTKFFVDKLGMKGILELIKDKKDRNAIATTEFAFFDGKNFTTSKCSIKGTIALYERGGVGKGFGWDTIFVPARSKASYAELSREEKSRISMRGRALKGLMKGYT